MIQTGETIHAMSWSRWIHKILYKLMRLGQPLPDAVYDMIKIDCAQIPTANYPALVPYANQGRWVIDCPFCPGAEIAFNEQQRFLCLSCFNASVNYAPIKVSFPVYRAAIEAILNKRPLAANRNNTLAGRVQTLMELKAENKVMGDDV